MRLYIKVKYLWNKCLSIISFLYEYYIFFIYFKNYKVKYLFIIYIYNFSMLCFMIGIYVVFIQRNILQILIIRRFVQIIQCLINFMLNVFGIFVMFRVFFSEGRCFGFFGFMLNCCRSLVKNRQSFIFVKGFLGYIFCFI